MGAKHKGVFTIEQVRDGIVIASQTLKNLVSDEGLDYYLDAGLYNRTPWTPAQWWAVGYQGAATIAAGMTYAAPPATELNAEVSTANRVVWSGSDPAGAQLMTNSASPASYTFASGVTVTAVGLVGSASNTKGDTGTGTLLNAVALSPTLTFAALDVMKITIQISQADDGV